VGFSKSQKSDSFGTNPTFAWDFLGTFGFMLLEKGGIQGQDHTPGFSKSEASLDHWRLQMFLNVDSDAVDGL
jgi:hypothetical protein